MKKQICYSNDGGKTWEGPLDEAEMEALRAVGVVTGETLVRTEATAASPVAGSAQASVPPPVSAGEARYMLFHNGVQSGPHSREALADMLRAGSASDQDKVWSEGMADWGSIKDVVKVAPQTSAELPSLKEFSFGHFFSTAFKHHTVGEAEELFCAGTAHGTPMLAQVNETWPAPWFFLRLMVFSLVLYFGFGFTLEHYPNPKLIPGWLVIGAFGFPICVLMLFYEMNVRKDVSAYRCVYMFLGGGLLSLIFTHVFASFIHSEHLYMAAAAEEPAKLLAVIMLAGVMRNGRILTGLLLGAAVGAGFAAFETAGYIYEAIQSTRLLSVVGTMANKFNLSDNAIVQVVEALGITDKDLMFAEKGREGMAQMRSVCTLIAGHTQWTAITAGTFWYVLHLRVKEHIRKAENKDFGFEVLSDFRFWRIALIPVALHAFWNSNLLAGSAESWYIKLGICGLVTWFFVFKLVAAGLKQVKQEKIEKGLVAATK